SPPSLPSFPTRRSSDLLAIGSHLARDARHFASERAELVHHDVECVLELEDFTQHIDCDFARKIALRHGRGEGRSFAQNHSRCARSEEHTSELQSLTNIV